MRSLVYLAAALMATTAVPAAAQYSGGNFTNRIERLQDLVQQGVASGRLTRGEAESLRGELRQLREVERQFGRDGFSTGERDELERRIDTLQQRLQSDRRDTEYRDRDGDGSYDRDDRRDRDDRYGRDDRNYRDCPPGLAKKNNGCLPPGQEKKLQVGRRFPDGMGSEVPYQYRDRYRDTNRYFHRYYGNNVYRIDRRTLIIVAVIFIGR